MVNIPTLVGSSQEPCDFSRGRFSVDKSIVRTNTDCVKAIKLILSNNPTFDIEIAKAFFELAPYYGIDPMMAIAQSIVETGWFKYEGSAVKPEHHNYCGLGVTSNGVEGGIFTTIKDGINAQLQHLFAYGSKDNVPVEVIIDPRFKYVTRGIAPYWQQLAGRWAVPGYDKKAFDTPEKAMSAGNTYGQKIRAIYKQLIAVAISEDDIEKWFPSPKIEPTNPVNPTEHENKEDKNIEKKETSSDEQADNIVNIIINVIKKLVTMLFNVFTKGDK